ncbi:MAG TPA: TIGR03089 family protein [Actinomycetales bacterium]|nr:TIGR03089 family protein [Actinomycetales bacterium]
MPTPTDVLAALLRSDPARPRVTFYDDTVNAGERIELSAKVLANWVNKAANLLQEELEVGPGAVVRLDLPATHWRTLYWALGTWSVGATVDLTGDRPVDLLVTADAGAAAESDADAAALVTLAALARQHPEPVPDDVIDEARDLSTFADQFDAWETPTPDAGALVTEGGTFAYGDVVPTVDWPTRSRVYVGDERTTPLRDVLAAWSVDGSVVLGLGLDADRLPTRLEAEGVTLTLR